MKHIISILDMVDDLDHIKPSVKDSIFLAKLPQWDEKIGDAINYLILLRALVEERTPVQEQELNDTEHFVCNDH